MNGCSAAERALRRPAPNFDKLIETITGAAVDSHQPDRLQAAWLLRMLASPDPLRERLALMWHNHFATGNQKVQDLAAMRRQNDIFRKYALAPFGGLLAQSFEIRRC